MAFVCVVSMLQAEELSQKSGRLRNAYFGDLHVHTSYSLDGFIYSNTLDPEVAYQFARGRESDYKGHYGTGDQTPSARTRTATGVLTMALR